jgi:UTP:GlnB (protein PII) uridylyltransferase
MLLNPQGQVSLIEDELTYKLTNSDIHTQLMSPKKEDTYVLTPSQQHQVLNQYLVDIKPLDRQPQRQIIHTRVMDHSTSGGGPMVIRGLSREGARGFDSRKR